MNCARSTWEFKVSLFRFAINDPLASKVTTIQFYVTVMCYIFRLEPTAQMRIGGKCAHIIMFMYMSVNELGKQALKLSMYQSNPSYMTEIQPYKIPSYHKEAFMNSFHLVLLSKTRAYLGEPRNWILNKMPCEICLTR